MNGFTNARGVAEPDLSEILSENLNAYSQTLLISLDEIRAQVSALQRRCANPFLGAVVKYAGYDWIVCHLDYEKELCYLALKEIKSLVKFSELNDTEFRGSALETALKQFDDELIVFSRGTIRKEGVCELEPVTFHSIVYQDGTTYSPTLYAFIPTRSQIEEEFDLFNGDKFGRRVAAYLGHVGTGTYNSQSYWIHSYDNLTVESEFHSWWTCTESGGKIVVISPEGTPAVTPISSESGFRPFVCMKMR